MWTRRVNECEMDTIFVENIDLAADIGQRRKQRVLVSVLLHLDCGSLDFAAAGDNKNETVAPNALRKAVAALVDAPDATFDGPVALAHEVTRVVLETVEETTEETIEVEAYVEVPKLVRMAETFRVEMRTGTSNLGKTPFSRTEVVIDGLEFRTQVGLTMEERNAKHPISVRIQFEEDNDGGKKLDYAQIVKGLYKMLESDAHYMALTMERFAVDIIRDILYARGNIWCVCVQARMSGSSPSASASGVQLARSRRDLKDGVLAPYCEMDLASR